MIHEHPLDIAALLAALDAGDVEFMVIGGVAVAIHGFERGTKDLDIVPRPERENLERLHRVLVEIEAAALGAGDLRPEESVPFDPDGLASGGNWCLMTKAGRIDVLQYVAGVLDDEEDLEGLWERSVVFDAFGRSLRVVSYQDLIAFKTEAGRDVDLIDIRALREAHGDDGPST